ncbi:MAG TPA: LysM domain-containing protein [Solirubrobacterales bacterium]|nr:LysM domain-containing protein [Solirubrobacterales bacterium]
MAHITQHLTSISLDSRSGAPPGRRLLALTLVAMLVLGSVFPGFALAGEVDSEGEGTVAPVEVPVAPDFDPGGEEEGLEEAPAAGGEEEGGTVEAEAELEVPPADEVSSAATGAPSEPAASAPSASPEPAPSAPETAPAEQPASEPAASEPVANQSIVAPKQKQAAASGTSSGEAAPASEPAPEEEAPSAPPAQPAATPPPDHGRHLAGKGSYVVQSGDCLWHIAAGLLPGDADDAQIAAEVARLWDLNKSAIGTGDPSLIYAGTRLSLR